MAHYLLTIYQPDGQTPPPDVLDKSCATSARSRGS